MKCLLYFLAIIPSVYYLDCAALCNYRPVKLYFTYEM